VSPFARPEADVHPWVAAQTSRVRFGVAYGPRDDWAAARTFAQLVEGLGYDSYWVMDHPVTGFDCWTSLAVLATATERVRLGPLVSCVYYRSPVLLARLAADVDSLSGGRLVLGLGMGNHAKEFRRLGLAFPPPAVRLGAVAETVQIVAGLWGERPFTYQGKQFAVAGGLVRPGPVQRPRVPLLIAGGGERVTLRQVARYADAANFSAHAWAGSAFGLDDVRRKLDVLRRHCADLGRPYEGVLRSQVAVPVVLAESDAGVARKLAQLPAQVRASYATSTVAGTPERVRAHYRALVDAGLTYFVLGVYGADEETVRLFAEHVAPALSG
jgi:alkanesulfonate monooxygenase SsuD/methylene tetrahydromethanopterin reductase-like flavin-dependent oxidoreductase (luciferase family)